MSTEAVVAGVVTGRRGRVAVGLLAGLALWSTGSVPVSAAPAPPRVVSLSFDDGRASQSVVGGLLAARHLEGTFFIISRAVNTGNDPESLTWTQIQQLARAGNEVGGHTRTHPHLPKLSPAAQTTEICGGRQDLIAQGYHPVSFAYPYGEYTKTTEDVVRSCGYADGRAANGGVETIPPKDRYAIRTLHNVTVSDTAAELEAATMAAKPGQWLNWVFHDIGGPTVFADPYRMPTKDFTAFLDWLAHQRDAGTVVVRTVGDVMTSRAPAPVPRG